MTAQPDLWIDVPGWPKIARRPRKPRRAMPPAPPAVLLESGTLAQTVLADLETYRQAKNSEASRRTEAKRSKTLSGAEREEKLAQANAHLTRATNAYLRVLRRCVR